MTFTIHSASGETVHLADTPFARGGEAAVHEVPAYPSVVVKLFHPDVLQKRAASLHAKIDAMTSDPRLAAFKQHPGLAWPRFSVFDASKQWRGYAMRRAAGVRMTLLAHAMAYREHFPGLDRPAIVTYLLNLLRVIDELHAANVLIGDYNPANFLCDPDSGAVTLIDCDSWQADAGNQRFRCPVAAPDMLPPELQGVVLGKVNRTLESERFSLAILLFKVLMLGRHPFDICGGASPVENIRSGRFPYGMGGGGIPVGPWFNIWSHLPFKMKEQLIRTFGDGSRSPEARTAVTEWTELLKLYQRGMERDWHDQQIVPAMPKPNQYRGSQSLPQLITG